MTPAPDFDRLARVYRWLEYASFGPLLMRTRLALHGRLAECRNALVLGDGDGRFSATLLRANPQLRITAVDTSAAMLTELSRRCPADRLLAVHADARYLLPPYAPWDAVVTHFFLDCLTREEVASLTERLTAATTGNARWLISEFAVPEREALRLPARWLIWALYAAFSLLTGLRVRQIPPYADLLAAAGWRLTELRTRLGGILRSELWVK